MVRDNRIKDYRFTPFDLITNTNGNLLAFSKYSLNGTIHKIEVLENNFLDNGSLYVMISGTNEKIWGKNGTINTSGAFYPQVYPVDNDNNTGSPYIGFHRVISSPVLIVGSGLGTNKSGLGLNVVYI